MSKRQKMGIKPFNFGAILSYLGFFGIWRLVFVIFAPALVISSYKRFPTT
jgi:hypothetical protein